MSPGLEVIQRRFESPDEIREFEKGRFELIHIGGMTIGRATYQPGWKWSQHVRPQDGPAVEGVLDGRVVRPARPHRERPLRAREVLRLRGDQPPDDRDRILQRTAFQMLAMEPLSRDVGVVHSRTTSVTSWSASDRRTSSSLIVVSASTMRRAHTAWD